MNINLPALFHDPLLVKLFAVLGTDHVRYVGGCVRNAILNLDIADIDIATTHPPQKVIDMLTGHGIEVITTGLKHGTVSVPFGLSLIEITTLRRDISTDGRHAVVSFEHDWAIDAARRDFTINALYMDQNGQIFDPLGLGLFDLTHRRVRFIGDVANRIREDHLRILRFFRFSLYYAHSVDPDGLLACTKFAQSVLTLSRERVSRELFKILAHDECSNILKLMKSARILSMLYQRSANWPQTLGLIIDLQGNLQCTESGIDPPLRLSPDMILCQRILSVCGPQKCLLKNSDKNLPIAAHLSLSRAQTNLIKEFAKLVISKKEWTLFNFNVLRYEKGEDFARATAMILYAYGRIAEDAYAKFLSLSPIPNCPIKARDLIALGYKGSSLGKKLKICIRSWLREYSKLHSSSSHRHKTPARRGARHQCGRANRRDRG